MKFLHTHHRPRWYFIPVRVLLVTFLLTLLSFAVSLLLGIFTLVTVAVSRGVNPNLTTAYRHIAFPAAVVAASASLVCMTVVEIRRFQRERALAIMAQVSAAS